MQSEEIRNRGNRIVGIVVGNGNRGHPLSVGIVDTHFPNVTAKKSETYTSNRYCSNGENPAQIM